ncbi:thaumatin-like protein 1b isoform X2 [Panicum virgatum]|uniref:thaumatin-like protein 1b isoform X2 n=1 Tax=Panicum virgatum TaxID=38727 RepID=UPI0019D59604|nr:thaumatin-like protein 1b isoform X2 [Panicum virgatum]
MLGQEHRPPIVLLLILIVSVSGVSSRTLTIANHCGHTVWPGILSSSGSPPLETTGFALEPGQSRSLPAPHGWSGRLWGRTHCAADSAGKFACATGNCGSGRLDCAGHGAKPPATLAEFTFDGHGGMDFYDVSLVDGYNLPMLVVPHHAHGAAAGPNCAVTGCAMDLNAACPAELRVGMGSDAAGGRAVACRSACEAFGSAEHCCHGEHGNPNTCWPTAYSQFFKKSCPRAYSYAYDDATSTFTCGGGGGGVSYSITFCPSTTSVKSVGTDAASVGGGRVGSSSSPRAVPRLGYGGLVLHGVAIVALARVF